MQEKQDERKDIDINYKNGDETDQVFWKNMKELHGEKVVIVTEYSDYKYIYDNQWFCLWLANLLNTVFGSAPVFLAEVRKGASTIAKCHGQAEKNEKNMKTALITGATSGIGTVVARHLVHLGYSLIVLGRSSNKLVSLADELGNINSSVKTDTILCDLSSLDSVSAACNEISKSYGAIDLMVLNAGLWNFKFIETTDKIEETLQVNLIAPVMIFNSLKDLIPKNAGSKVIFTSSGLHQGVINFQDIEFRDKFLGFKAYRQSKLGLIMLTRWLALQSEYNGISFYSVHPGMVNTQLGRSAGWLSRTIFKLLGKSSEKGAETHIHLIEKKVSELKSGEYYANCKVTGTTSYSYDMKEAKRLWDVLEQYIGNQKQSY